MYNYGLACHVSTVETALQRLAEVNNISFFFMKTETMQLLMDLFFLAHHLRTTVGLSVIDNGLGPLVWGAEEKIVDYALLAADQKATLPSQVQTSAVVILK